MNTKLAVALLGLVVSVASPAHAAANSDASAAAPGHYQEGFEKKGEAPVRVWASNGIYELHQLAAVEDPDAAEGSHSLKVDVTLQAGSYLYVLVPMRVRPEGALALEGKIRLNSAWPKDIQLRFGAAYDDPSKNVRGNVVPGKAAPMAQDRWSPLTAELGSIAKVSDVAHTQGWAIFITGKFNGQRVSFSIDDVQLRGAVVADLDGLLKKK